MKGGNIFNNLTHYMFTRKFIMNIEEDTKQCYNKKNIKKNKDVVDNSIQEDIFYPKEKDTLFWISYIIENDFLKYELDSKREFIKEKETKIELIEFVRKNKTLLKEHKWKLSKLEDDLNSSKPISKETFFCLCFLKNKDVIIKKGNIVYSQINSQCDDGNTDFSNTIILEYNNTLKKYGMCNYSEGDNGIKAREYLDKYYIIDNINKPLKAISNYKIAEIHDICKKLNINIFDGNGKKIKKKDLYEEIKLYI